jgi:hypothetical protein
MTKLNSGGNLEAHNTHQNVFICGGGVQVKGYAKKNPATQGCFI